LQLTREEMVAKAVSQTVFSEADVVGMLACSPEELALMVKAIHDRHQRPPKSAWDEFLAILAECDEVANMVSPIAGAVTGIFAVAALL
jgi:hypothetical protein